MSDILSDEERAALAVGPDDEDQSGEVNDQQQETEEQREERARDEHGRFVAKEETDDQQEAEPKPKGDGKVPQGALHAERERRKQTEKALEEANQQLERIRQLRAGAQKAPEQQTEQQVDENSVEYLRAKIAELETGQKQTKSFLENQQLDVAEHNQLVSALNVAENEFRQDHPDYDAAINHVVNARAQELALYGLQPAEIQATVSEEISEIARAAIQQKKNPAEVGYELARLRGYTPQQTQTQEQTQINGFGKAKDIVAAVKRAQEQGKSLGQAAGGATAQTINADTIARMTQDEFDALYATPEGQALIDSIS